MSCLPTLAFSNRNSVGASNPHKKWAASVFLQPSERV